VTLKFCRFFWKKFSTRTFCKNMSVVFLNSPYPKTPKNVLLKKKFAGRWVGPGYSKCTGDSVENKFGGPSGGRPAGWLAAGWVGASLGFRLHWQAGGWVPFWDFLGFLRCGLAKQRNPASCSGKKVYLLLLHVLECQLPPRKTSGPGFPGRRGGGGDGGVTRGRYPAFFGGEGAACRS
jgi:hypothetical protein